jgi:hypothetical protein
MRAHAKQTHLDQVFLLVDHLLDLAAILERDVCLVVPWLQQEGGAARMDYKIQGLSTHMGTSDCGAVRQTREQIDADALAGNPPHRAVAPL